MPKPDIGLIANNLICAPDGIWYAKDRSAVSYPEEGNENCIALEEDSFWFEHRSRCILAVMRRFPPTGVLFDVGGGNGFVSTGLQRAGIETILVEPGKFGAQTARRRGVEQVICSTLEDARFKPGCLPCVGIFDVLEHMREDVAFLQSLNQLLIPGGRLYLSVPAYPWLWSADDDYSGHFRRYTLASLYRVIQAAGLRVEYATYFFSMLPAPIFVGRVLPTRLGLRGENAWNSYSAEHRSRSGLVGSVLGALLKVELGQIQAGRILPLGGSCLLAAAKI